MSEGICVRRTDCAVARRQVVATGAAGRQLSARGLSAVHQGGDSMKDKYAKQRAELLNDLDGLRVEVDANRRIATLILDRPPLKTVSYKARSQIAALFDEMGRDT